MLTVWASRLRRAVVEGGCVGGLGKSARRILAAVEPSWAPFCGTVAAPAASSFRSVASQSSARRPAASARNAEFALLSESSSRS